MKFNALLWVLRNGVIYMSYSINPSLFKSIFAVPTDIVDKHIRLANEHQLKVLLWILCKSPDNPDISKMCADINIDINDTGF